MKSIQQNMLLVQRVLYAVLAACFILAPFFKPATTYGKVVLIGAGLVLLAQLGSGSKGNSFGATDY